MKSCPKLRRLQFHENGFAFDPATGLTYSLSATSLRVIAWLAEGASEEELPARLAAEYDVEPHAARRDVTNFLSALRAYKLL